MASERSHTTADREYTREEMREACRNNYYAGMEAFRSRVEDAIIAAISDPQNAAEPPGFRRGLLIARIILNGEAKMSSFPERFACGQCAKAIREAADEIERLRLALADAILEKFP